MEKRWLNERPAGAIISFESVGHSLRREKDSGSEPDCAQREVEATRQLCKGAHLRIVNAAETVRLHHSVPHTPHERNQHNAF